MRRFLFAAVLASSFAAGAAQAQDDSFTERAVVSCLSGATVSGLTTGLVLMPLANTGIGTTVAASAVALSAGVGCGFGLAFTTAAAGYSWAWRSMVAAPSEPTSARTRPLPEQADPKSMIHAAR